MTGMTAGFDVAAPPGYRLVRPLGRGGSGVVVEALQESTGRAVAVKLLESTQADGAALRQFERERAVMADLATHPGIVSIIDAGLFAGRPWLAMDLCRRGSLARAGALPTTAVVTTMYAVASALAAAHDRGVVHCDVKPANILVTDYGLPALGDFGVARLAVSEGSTVGGYTLDHVAPEVIDGQRPTDRSDVFSLGTAAWQLLVGRAPFRRPGDAAGAVLDRLRREPLPPLERADVPRELAVLLARMTDKAPARRPSAADVARAVSGIAQAHGLGVGAPIEELVPATDLTDLRGAHPSRPSSPMTGAPPAGMPMSGSGTDHRPDLAMLTHAGRAAALGAPAPALAVGAAARRRDPVVVLAVVAAAVVLLSCGGFVTARMLPSSTTPSVVTTASGEQQVVPAAVLPPGEGGPGAPVELETAGTSGPLSTGRARGGTVAAPRASPAPTPAVPPVPVPKPVTPGATVPPPLKVRLWIQKDCSGPNVSQCNRSQGVPTIFTKVTADDGGMWNNCTEHVVVDGPGNVNYVDVTTACNASQTRSVGTSVELGTYTATITVKVDGRSVGPQKATFEVIE